MPDTGRYTYSDMPLPNAKSALMISENWKKYNTPPQIIYKIDDHRFITLESYDNCSGETWYNDTKSGVRTRVGHTSPNGFLGKLIIDDQTGMNVVVPTVTTGSCGDRGCMNYAAYSTDGGKTFAWMRYDESNITFDSQKSSKDYTFLITSDRLYVVEGRESRAYVAYYPLVPGINLGKPYPPSIRGGSFNLSTDPELLTSHRTPSGQDHYICDTSILPTNGD
ncbi:T6SS immunity protein Tli3 family protein [Caballeronia glebae]|uniref:T6SS immunity protein Tli3 family protein n=1 Tax=Caballeronia glebae TaxID=1777143 RepID=UPI0038BBD26E